MALNELERWPGVRDDIRNWFQLGLDAKLFYRDLPSRAEGPLLRQSENVYALNENTEVRFLVRQRRATWSIVYTGGMLMDPMRRVK